MPFDTCSPTLAAAEAGVYYLAIGVNAIARFSNHPNRTNFLPFPQRGDEEFFVAGDATHMQGLTH